MEGVRYYRASLILVLCLCLWLSHAVTGEKVVVQAIQDVSLQSTFQSGPQTSPLEEAGSRSAQGQGDSSGPCVFPERLGVVITRQADTEADDIVFTIVKNKVVIVPSRVVVMREGDVFESKEIAQDGVAYHNYDKQACIVARCSINQNTGATIYILEGTLFHDGVKLKLSPTQRGVDLDSYDMDEIEEYREPTDHGYIEPPARVNHYKTSPRHRRATDKNTDNRRKRSVTDYFIDILPVIDYALYSKWLVISFNDDNLAFRNLAAYFANLATGVSLRYSTLNLRNDVVLNLRLLAPVVATDPSMSMFTENYVTPLPDGGNFVRMDLQLTEFREWLFNNTDSLDDYDHAMLFSGYEVYGTEPNIGGTKGLAYVGTACDREGYSSSVSQDRLGYQSEVVAAHELGHSFGSYHDGDGNGCSSSDRYIMAASVLKATPTTLRNPFSFSECSSVYISDYIEYVEQTYLRDVCLIFDLGSAIPSTPSFGIDVKSACTSMFGSNSQLCTNPLFCPPLDEQHVCTSLYCLMSDQFYCEHIVPPSGTCCANGKMCIQGVCTAAAGGLCVMDEDCPFTDNPDCDTHESLIGSDMTRCFDEFAYSYCCRMCANRMDYAVSPTSPPEMIVNGAIVDDTQAVVVDLDSQVNVRCSVFGGIPIVTNVTIRCQGLDDATMAGQYSSLQFTASLDMNRAQCVCSAVHIIELYDLTTTFVVELTSYPPQNPPQLTVNGDPIISDNIQEIDIGVGETIDIHCSVSGGFPDVSSVTIGCTGMQSVTQDGTTASKSLVIGEDENRAECVCSGDHITDEYNQTTSFVIKVLSPPQMTSYSINSEKDQSQDIHITAGESASFVCQARGLPAPDVSLRRHPVPLPNTLWEGTSGTLPSDEYATIVSTTRRVVCTDTGMYRCVASNDVGDDVMKQLSVVVDCPPTVQKSTLTPKAQINNMGQFRVAFQAMSNPKINRINLSKYRTSGLSGGSGSGSGRVSLVKDYEANEFLADVKYKDLVNTVTVDVFDTDPDERDFYTLQMSNGIQEPVSVSFNSTFVQDASYAKVGASGQVGSEVNLYAVVCVVGVLVCALVLGTVVYVNVYQKETRLLKETRRRESKRRTLKIHPMDNRMWMANPGFQYY